MASNVYEVPDTKALKSGLSSAWSIYGEAIHWSGRGTGGVEKGGLLGSGFKGCIYKSSDEVVVAFKGTGGGHGFKDVLADAKLAVGVVPREATAAKDLYEQAARIAPPQKLTVIGHSLGGGLTQLMGHWYKCRFVTFNAPPMMGCIQKAKMNIFKPQQQFRAIQASFRSGAIGLNYRLKGDGVSSRLTSTLGHYGNVVTMTAPGVWDPLTAHSMETFLDYLERSSDGNEAPFDFPGGG